MDYTLKPIVYENQFTIWLRDTFPEWSDNDIDDVLDVILDDQSYTEVYFVNNDEDLSLVDEDERVTVLYVNPHLVGDDAAQRVEVLVYVCQSEHQLSALSLSTA